MRRVHIILGLAAALSGGFVLFKAAGSDGRGLPEYSATVRALPEPADGAPAKEDELAMLTTVDPSKVDPTGNGSRTAVDTEHTEQAADPCTEIRAEYQAAEAERLELAREQPRLRARIAALELELQLLEADENTPLGAFLRSYEAEEMSSEVRKLVGERLQAFPVFLRPGEATWIAARLQNGDWRQFGQTSQEALIRFLGPQRLLVEAPSHWIEEQKRWLDGHEWLALFGTPKPD